MFSVVSVHQSVILTTGGEPHVAIAHDAFRDPRPNMEPHCKLIPFQLWPIPPTPCAWDLTVQRLSSPRYVHSVARTVGKPAVCILLKCYIVFLLFHIVDIDNVVTETPTPGNVCPSGYTSYWYGCLRFR